MTPTVKRLIANVEKAQAELYAYRDQCKHVNAVRVPHSDTGNYDPSDDSYWYECECPRCGKVWDEPQ